MRKTTPVFGRNRKPGYPCAIPLKSHTDLQRKYANINRQPLFLASFCNKFPATGDKALRRLVSQDCVRHQEVAANRPGFGRPQSPLADDRIASSKPSGSAVPESDRRPVTVLFCDMVGFTRLSSELDPEELHTLLERFFTVIDTIVDRFGGTIDKHIGDASMALFGAPVAHGNDVERAVRAALEIYASLPDLKSGDEAPLAAHIGVAVGEVVASSVGSDHHRGYTVTGEAPNVAALLLSRASSGETLVSDAVYHATSHTIAYEPFGSLAEGVQPSNRRLAPDRNAYFDRGRRLWDVLRLHDEVIEGLRRAAAHVRGSPVTIEVDAWGVDYAYLDSGGALMAPMRHMRDPRTDGVYEGTMTIQINTLAQSTPRGTTSRGCRRMRRRSSSRPISSTIF